QVGASGAKVQVFFDQRDGGTTEVEQGDLLLSGGGVLGQGRFVVGELSPFLAFDAGAYSVMGAHVIEGAIGSEMRIRGTSIVEVQGQGSLALDGVDLLLLTDGVTLEQAAQLGGAGPVFNRSAFHWLGTIGVAGQADFRNEAAGQVMIPAGAGARLRGSLKNEGSRVFQDGSLDMANSAVLNTGEWFLRPKGSDKQISGINALFTNEGTLDGGSAEPTHRTVTISANFDNRGEVVAIGPVTLNFTGAVAQVQNGVLEGGSWVAHSGGRILLPGVPPIFAIRNARVYGSRANMPWLAGVVEVSQSSRLDAVDDIVFEAPLIISSRGLVVSGPGADVTVPLNTTVGEPGPTTVLSYIEQAPVFSDGPQPRLITPVLIVHEGLRPGGPDTPGPFNLTGTLTMMPTGVMEVELGGPIPETEHDRMAITGSAALAGTLDLRLLPGFVPLPGQTFTVLTASGGRSGTFGSVSQPAGMPAGLALQASYTANAVVVSVVGGCYPNCDGSTTAPILNVQDFGCFLSRYAAGDPYANCDGSTQPPVLNVQDFGCFLTRYAAGCP
ncbi:MAG: GC-type dockerin domain-anchored protein, partial [Phycisphaerales bacterium]